MSALWARYGGKCRGMLGQLLREASRPDAVKLLRQLSGRGAI